MLITRSELKEQIRVMMLEEAIVNEILLNEGFADLLAKAKVSIEKFKGAYKDSIASFKQLLTGKITTMKKIVDDYVEKNNITDIKGAIAAAPALSLIVARKLEIEIPKQLTKDMLLKINVALNKTPQFKELITAQAPDTKTTNESFERKLNRLLEMYLLEDAGYHPKRAMSGGKIALIIVACFIGVFILFNYLVVLGIVSPYVLLAVGLSPVIIIPIIALITSLRETTFY